MLTCEHLPARHSRVHVRTDHPGHCTIRSRVRPVVRSRTYGGQDLGQASDSANRWLSPTVTGLLAMDVVDLAAADVLPTVAGSWCRRCRMSRSRNVTTGMAAKTSHLTYRRLGAARRCAVQLWRCRTDFPHVYAGPGVPGGLRRGVRQRPGAGLLRIANVTWTSLASSVALARSAYACRSTRPRWGWIRRGRRRSGWPGRAGLRPPGIWPRGGPGAPLAWRWPG